MRRFTILTALVAGLLAPVVALQRSTPAQSGLSILLWLLIIGLVVHLARRRRRRRDGYSY
jgi:type IV secretory pathway TrbD component